MMALFWLVDRLLSLYIWAVILSAVFSILTSFGVLDTRNRIVWTQNRPKYLSPARNRQRQVSSKAWNIDLPFPTNW